MKTKQYTEEKTLTVNGEKITAFKVKHDSNGNPRWVIHFLDLLTSEEQASARKEAEEAPFFTLGTSVMFRDALNKARKSGGKAYRPKWFGGGIVFQSYNIQEDISNVFAA